MHAHFYKKGIKKKKSENPECIGMAEETGQCPICNSFIAEKLVNTRIRFVTRADIRQSFATRLENIVQANFEKHIEDLEIARKDNKEIEKKYSTLKAEIVHMLDITHQIFQHYGKYNWTFNTFNISSDALAKLNNLKKGGPDEKAPDHHKPIKPQCFESINTIKDVYLRIRNCEISHIEPPKFLNILDRIKEPMEAIDSHTNLEPFGNAVGGWVYHGTYYNKKKDGWGKLISPDRSQFWEGYFENGISEGYGLWIHRGGHFYIGNYKNGLRHGFGLYFFPTGKVLEGESVQDKNSGFKIIYSGHDKRVCFKGNMKDGTYSGYGVEYFLDGDIFEGYFEKGNRSGYGYY